MTKLAFLTTFLAGASAAVLPRSDIPTAAPKLPLSAFETHPIHFLSPDEIVALVNNGTQQGPQFSSLAPAATCSSPRTRQEWHRASDTVKQKYIDAVKCLQRNPSKGGYPGSQSRYEDFVQVHQAVADNVHNNRKFLVWHRAFLWAYEETLRSECGYTESLPWFDETLYPGKFSTSSIFSSQWFGAIALNGNCVTDGQFANLALHIGPGTGNTPHCLARAGDSSWTSRCTDDVVQSCKAANDYQVFAECEEGSIHAYGHYGVGAVMQDFYASPSDPVFWLHHGMVDRHFRVWQNIDSSRTGYIDGNGPDGKPLTLDTGIVLNGLKPNLKIGDVMNTMGGFLCYKYDY